MTDEEIRGFSTPEPSIFTTAEKLSQSWDKENLLDGGFRVFVAEQERGIVGFIVFRMERDYGYIDNLIVAKEMQGQGVGRALVTYVEGLTKSNGCHLIKTDTTENEKNVPWKSYNFWITMGYKDTGERLPTPYDFKEIPFVKRLNR